MLNTSDISAKRKTTAPVAVTLYVGGVRGTTPVGDVPGRELKGRPGVPAAEVGVGRVPRPVSPAVRPARGTGAPPPVRPGAVARRGPAERGAHHRGHRR